MYTAIWNAVWTFLNKCHCHQSVLLLRVFAYILLQYRNSRRRPNTSKRARVNIMQLYGAGPKQTHRSRLEADFIRNLWLHMPWLLRWRVEAREGLWGHSWNLSVEKTDQHPELQLWYHSDTEGQPFVCLLSGHCKHPCFRFSLRGRMLADR